MPTVIDSLVVSIGFDTKALEDGLVKLAKAMGEARQKVKDDGEAIEKPIKNVDKPVKDLTASFAKLRNEVLLLFAVFTAGKGIKEFVADETNAVAETGRLAKLLDTTVQTLSAWRGAATVAGGSAGGMTSAMAGLVGEFQNFALTGESNVVPYFRALQVQFADSKNHMRDIGDIMLDLAGAFHKLNDPARAAAFGRAMGFDAGTITLLIQGREAVAAFLEEQKKLGIVNEEQAKNLGELQAAWRRLSQASETLGRIILSEVAPAITGLVNILTSMAEWLGAHPKILEGLFVGFSALIAAITTFLTGAFFTALGTLTATILPALSGAFIALGAAMAATPVGWIVGAISGLIALGAVLYSNWDSIGKWWHNFWNGAASDAENGSNRINGAVNDNQAGSYRVSQNATVSKLQAMGWTREQAIGIAANIQSESGGNSQATNGSHLGLAQWDRNRQADFQAWSGKSMQASTADEQLAFLNYELRNGKYAGVGRRLAATTNAGDAAAIVNNQYEVSSNTPQGLASNEAARRATALRIAASNSNISNSTVTSSVTNIENLNLHTQATNGADAAHEFSAALAPLSQTGTQ